MKRVLPVLFLAVLLALAGCQPGEVVPTGQATTQPADIPRISAEELQQRLQAGEAIVVADARNQNDYNREHIVGAISVPFDKVAEHLRELPKDKFIVFYCT